MFVTEYNVRECVFIRDICVQYYPAPLCLLNFNKNSLVNCESVEVC
jgi:hypothetical protein